MVRRVMMAVFIVVMAALTTIPADAGDLLAFKRKLPTVVIQSGTCFWVQCGSIQITAPEEGFVVVTASGMAYTRSLSPSSLTLTLGKDPAVQGVWMHTLSPGRTPYQSYNAEMTFSVNPGLNTFFLNARSCDGDGRNIGVQTGSLTAEFYPTAGVQPQASPASPKSRSDGEPVDVHINNAF